MDDVLRQIVGVFAAEVKEQAEKIAACVLAIDGDPETTPVQIEELFRQAHSLKGSSSSLGVEELERLAHNLEEAFMSIRRGQGQLTPALVDAALAAMDAARLRADGLVVDSGLGLPEAQKAAALLLELAGRAELGAEPLVEPEVARAAPGEAAAAPPSHADDGETLRVAAARLLTLERRLDELRMIRGRLDHRASSVSTVLAELEQLWRSARAHQKGNLEARVTPDALYQVLRQMGSLRRDLFDDAELAQANALELDENLRAMRMVPAALLDEPIRRAIRDACRRVDKEARFEFRGADGQIDRRLLEELKSPLVHLVRNAVDHGIEAPIVREAVGKTGRALIELSVEQRGAEVYLAVRDDGRGIDLNRVRAAAVERGLCSDEAAARLTQNEVYDLLFQPGFSTAEQVTELSGRGVGLDVVRDAIDRLHGRIELHSDLGHGTTFTLVVPLTVAASEVMLIEEAGRPVALPLSSIERIVRARATDLRVAGRRIFFHLDDEPLPVIPLARVLGLAERQERATYRTLAVVRGGGGERAVVICERLLGSRDLVLRPVPPELREIALLDATAILPTGQAIFVLSPRALAAQAAGATLDDTRARPQAQPGTILVADDSITTRSLLRTALEASGFRVRTAADGEEALRLALAEPFDLVVSDVRMPRLDGLGLTTRLRGNARTANVPVVLFSSLSSEEDQRRGSASGASAYLSKGAFDRGRLLEVVTSLIGGKEK
jgi:chemotaxis protein histidine kinase CheA/CheY-like chemotaxis protein